MAGPWATLMRVAAGEGDPVGNVTMAVDDVPVLIVGGGPVGLTARVLLQRWGVRSLLVEKHTELSPFPRSRLVNVRSMEILRQLELASIITSRAFPPCFGRVRFCDTLLGQDFAMAEMVGIGAPIPDSPELGVVSSQDRLEPILLTAANTELRFGVELVDLVERPEGVVASLIDHRDGSTARVAARYVIAADGASSTVRELLGIATAGPGGLADFTTVVFDAELERWCGERPAGVYFTSQGAFAPLHPEGGWAWFVPTPEGGAADWSDPLRRALGGGEAAVEVVRVQHWTMNALLAERFRHGRVLVAGDAAHAIPIIGGLGMNTGIADVHNLCWKLAGVIHGWAGPGLLDSYEAERRPVAQQTLNQAIANTRLMLEVQERRRRQHEGGGETGPIELPWTDRFFAQLGLVLGAAYESAAVLPDGSAAPELADPVVDYVPTSRPGHRLPHVELDDGRSSLDLLGEWFTLLVSSADPSGSRTPSIVRVGTLTPEQADQCALDPQGAVLVRPDGHVAARWRDLPPGGGAVREALAAVCDQPRATGG